MTVATQRHKAPQDIYAKHLVSHRGYPLWVPELKIQLPWDYQDHGLKIGDLGYVVPDKGCFEVLFNIRLPRDHDLHRGKRLPRNFKPISFDEADIATYENIEDAGCVISTSSVKEIEVNPVEHPSDYKFTLSSSEGALLILPQGADEHSLESDRSFGEYAKKHANEWYRFVEEDLKRTISYNPLYLITGFYKARSFALASFQEVEGSGDIPAQFKVTQLEGSGIVGGYGWNTSRAFDKRVGPKRYNGKANQAVYVKGFKVAVRDEPAGRKRISVKADGPSAQRRHEEFTDTVDSLEPEGPEDEKSAVQGTSVNHGSQHTAGHTSLQKVPQVLQPFHPSDAINRYLLRKEPSATVAITHDGQWAALLRSAGGQLEPHDLGNECLLLEALFEKHIMVSHGGSVFLLKAENMDICSSDTEGSTNTSQDGSLDLGSKSEPEPTNSLFRVDPLSFFPTSDTYGSESEPGSTNSLFHVDPLTFLPTSDTYRSKGELWPTNLLLDSLARNRRGVFPAPTTTTYATIYDPSTMEISLLPSSTSPLTCQWILPNGGICSFHFPEKIPQRCLSDHFCSAHDFCGINSKKYALCEWYNCGTMMRRESLMRHVHLGARLYCDICGLSFSRTNTLAIHKRREHHSDTTSIHQGTSRLTAPPFASDSDVSHKSLASLPEPFSSKSGVEMQQGSGVG